MPLIAFVTGAVLLLSFVQPKVEKIIQKRKLSPKKVRTIK